MFAGNDREGRPDAGEEPTELTDGDGNVLGVEDCALTNSSGQTLRLEVEGEPSRSGDFGLEKRHVKVAGLEVRHGEEGVLTIVARSVIPHSEGVLGG